MEAKRVLFEKDLPAVFQPLIDSRTPLPPDVTFFEGPEATKKGAAGWFVLAVVSALAAIVLGILAKKTYTTDHLSGDYYLFQKFLGGAIVCVIATVGWLWKAKVDLKRAQAAENGVAERTGLFLTPTALLIWADVCRLFPRDKVLSYKTDTLVKDGVTFLRSELTFIDAAGTEDRISHVEDCVVAENQAAAAAAIETWASA